MRTLIRRTGTADTRYVMIPDLRNVLDGWEYEPGRISVRKIIGRNGREKVQTRIDLGVLQIELDGRPDGERPNGHESHLDYLQDELAHHVELYGDDDDFLLTPEDCHELRREAYLYYQRYLSLFVLEDFERVVRDTARNLRAIEFCEQYAACREDQLALTTQRAYVLMMNARARAWKALNAGDGDAALAAVDAGVATLRQLAETEAAEDQPAEEPPAEHGEVRILNELRREILGRLPSNAPARLSWELHAALEREDYQKAARLRDALAAAHAKVPGR